MCFWSKIAHLIRGFLKSVKKCVFLIKNSSSHKGFFEKCVFLIKKELEMKGIFEMLFFWSKLPFISSCYFDQKSLFWKTPYEMSYFWSKMNKNDQKVCFFDQKTPSYLSFLVKLIKNHFFQKTPYEMSYFWSKNHTFSHFSKIPFISSSFFDQKNSKNSHFLININHN